jgi:hypothetical protein
VSFYKIIENIIFSIFLRRGYKKKVKKDKIQRTLWGMGGSGLSFVLPSFGCFVYSGVRGGGKCPEEEHTTCSGGPTILVTSAVYGEREYFKILYFKIL